jgi:hypothetical protein
MFARMQRRIQDNDAPAVSSSGANEDGESGEVVTEERARELEALERNRQKVLEGTPVNAETFAAWRVNKYSLVLVALVQQCNHSSFVYFFFFFFLLLLLLLLLLLRSWGCLGIRLYLKRHRLRKK